jgi:putative zinc finger protein
MSVDSLHPAPEELFAYRDGELSADRRALVETHVMACRACRELVDEMSKLEAALRARPDSVGDAYYERMQGQVMAKVHAAAPHPPARAPAREVPLERRKDDAEREERRGGAPRLPWIAIGSAVSAMAAVVVVVVLLARQGSMPQMAVLERSAPDAGLRGAVSDTTEASARGRLAAPPAGPPAGPPADARAKERQLAQTPSAKAQSKPTDQVALAPSAEGEKKDQAARNEVREEDLAKLESAPSMKRAQEIGGTASRDEAAGLKQAEPQAALAPPSAAGNRFESALSRYSLPPVWGPGVSDDLVLKAEPVFRNLYRTGGATTALDSARVRLYLAEAARLHAGAAPDSAAIDEIAHHYRRAISLGAADPATAGTAARRLREFLSEVGVTP